MKKILLSLLALASIGTLSAKQTLTEINFGITDESGAVTAWSWNQCDASKGYYTQPDSVWVSEYDYSDATGYDYIAIVLDKNTVAGKVVIAYNNWGIQKAVEFKAGQQLITIPVAELVDAENTVIANTINAYVVQPSTDGFFDIQEVAFISEAEYQELLAAENNREKLVVKATDVTIEMTDTDASSWNNVGGWIGESGLSELYKTIVLELESVSACCRVCIQSIPDYSIHEYFVAASETPVTLAVPFADFGEGNDGIGQVAITNRNITDFLIDSITGLPKEYTSPTTVKVSSMYYTSKEVSSTYTEATLPDPYEISFSEDQVTTAIAASYSSNLEGFTLTTTDTNSKMAIDANTAYFGLKNDTTAADENEEFAYRLKAGGKSSSKNSLTLSVPSDGVISICARSASSSAYDRTIVVTQNETELLNELVLDGMAVKDTIDETTVHTVYPIFSVPVKQGTVSVTYPVGAMNFYAFYFGSGYYVAPVAEEDPGEEGGETSDPVVVEGGIALPTVAEGDTIIYGAPTSSSWNFIGLLADGGAELTNANAAAGDVLRFYFKTPATANLQIREGHWADGVANYVEYSGEEVSYVDLTLTEDILTRATTAQSWGNVFLMGGAGHNTCYQITLIKAGATEETPVWNFAYVSTEAWTNSLTIPATSFTNVKAGQVMTIYFRVDGENPQLQYCTNNGTWANMIQSFELTASDYAVQYTLTEANLTDLQAADSYVQGNNITPVFISIGDAQADGIETIEEAKANQQAVLFNLAGQRVNQAKGLVIRQGKVILVK